MVLRLLDETPVRPRSLIDAATLYRLAYRVVAEETPRCEHLHKISQRQNTLEHPTGVPREIGFAQIAVPEQRRKSAD